MNIEKAYEIAFAKKRKSLKDKQEDYQIKTEKIYGEVPEYKKLCDELSSLGAEVAMTAFSGDEQKLAELRSQVENINRAKNTMLAAAGIKEIAYDCPLCKDTGYVDGKICVCIKRMAANEMLNASSGFDPEKFAAFDKFELDFYPDEPVGDIVPKKRMASILSYVKDYTDSFSLSTSENLLFSGATGLGKTFLSLAVFNDLILRGFNVIYKPAFNLFSEIETEHFKLHTDDAYNDALNADLLIIDDLGTEFVTSYTKSVFYNIINSRLLASKPTIINTNLSMREIESTYSSRISSRIIGNFTVKVFLGKDIRQLKRAYRG